MTPTQNELLHLAVDALTDLVTEEGPYQRELNRAKETLLLLRNALTEPVVEPCGYQYRMRAEWVPGWGLWYSCSKEHHEMYTRVPRLHDWVYETRAIYTSPPPPAEVPQAEHGIIRNFDLIGFLPLDEKRQQTVISQTELRDALERQMVEETQAPIYYMRDNHTFKKLNDDVTTALAEIEAEFNAGYTYGTLCSKRDGFREVHAHGENLRMFFLNECKERLESND